MNRIYYIKLIAVILLLLGISCSTEKNKVLNRGYHNMTAHYNGYWNAKEAIKVSLKDFEYNYTDNYDSILPLFIIPNNKESKAFYPVMDTSISKCATVIKRHSMPERKVGKAEGEEWGKWIDDNWLVLGQAQFYKRDYKKSEETFKYISLTYPEDKNKHWSRLWLAKTYIENQQYNAANRTLLELENEIQEQAPEAKSKVKQSKSYKKKKSKLVQQKNTDPVPADFSSRFVFEKKLTETHLYLCQQNFKKAIPTLIESIELTKNKALKARLNFILAQVYQESGDLELAGEHYKVVEKLHPKYDLLFQAQIKQVFVYSGGDSEELKRKLLKLSRDNKNVDYFDVIFYALADLEFKEKNEEKGVVYLKKSLAYSTNNSKQKGKSYLRLADFYYEKEAYKPAQLYFDSTLTVLNKMHKRYQSVERLNSSLKVLVADLNTINEQDSLRDLAENYSEKEIIKKIEKIIDQKQRAEEEAERQRASAPVIPTNNLGPAPGLGNQKNKFWAYDNLIRTQGYNDFKLVWGIRKNEDNWRRKNKSSNGFANNGSETDSEGIKAEYTIEYYMKDIPFSETQKFHSDSVLANAYYSAGTVFKQDLNKPKKALDMFGNVNSKYKTHRLAPASHYNSYLIYNNENNNSKKEQLKNSIITNYPDSEYAKILLDPDYLKNKENLAELNEKNYEALYELYVNKDYQEVIKSTEDLNQTIDTTNQFLCQSLYLRANSIGYLLEDKTKTNEYEVSLGRVIEVCPASKVAAVAYKTLAYIRNETSENLTSIGVSRYKYNENAKHYFVFVFEKNSGNSNDLKVDLANFSKSYFGPLKLAVSSLIYNSKKQLFIVKDFESKKQADDYLSAFKANKDQVGKHNKSDNYFIISQKNYIELYRNKDLEGYDVFYKKNYK